MLSSPFNQLLAILTMIGVNRRLCDYIYTVNIVAVTRE